MTRQTRQTGRARQTGEDTQAASQAAPASEVGPGRARQAQIYRAGVLGRPPRGAHRRRGARAAARRTMSRRAWAYVAGGAGEGTTMRPTGRPSRGGRSCRGCSRARPAGPRHHRAGAPAARSPAARPVGAADSVRRGSDVLIAAAAAGSRVPYVFSNQGCSPMEECAARWERAPLVPAVLVHRRELVDSLIAAGRGGGARGRRGHPGHHDAGLAAAGPRPGLPAVRAGHGIAQYTSDPRFREIVAERLARAVPAGARQGHAARGQDPGVDQSPAPRAPSAHNLRSPEPRAAVETFLDIYSNPGLTWEHLATLRERTALPIVLKGILHPDDAQRAVDAGVDGSSSPTTAAGRSTAAIAALDACPPCATGARAPR